MKTVKRVGLIVDFGITYTPVIDATIKMLQAGFETPQKYAEIRRNTQAKTPSNTQKYPSKNTPSKNPAVRRMSVIMEKCVNPVIIDSTIKMDKALRQCNNVLFDNLFRVIVVCTRNQFQRLRREPSPDLLRHATLTTMLRSVA